jgi:general secretion pathway protein I
VIARSSARRAQGGFTLIEMVAAFFIFALAFALLVGSASAGLRKVRLAGESTRAALYAQAKIDSLGVTEKLEEGSEQGRFDEDYRFELEVKKTEPPPASNGNLDQIPVDLYRIDVTVRWGERGHDRSAHFATLRAVGAGAAPQARP